MKSQKGITLISLTVYIICITVVVATISMISSFFFSDINETTKNIDPLLEYTRFTEFFTNEINKENISVTECQNNYILFSNGSQYTFINDQGIYKNKIKICKLVKKCTFEYNSSNKIVTVDITMKNGENQNIQYTIKN